MNSNIRRLKTNYFVECKYSAHVSILTSENGDRKAAGKALLRAYRGLPKNKRLIKLLNEPEYQKISKPKYKR